MESESGVICSDFVNLIREIKIALNQNIETEVHISDILFMHNSRTHTHTCMLAKYNIFSKGYGAFAVMLMSTYYLDT